MFIKDIFWLEGVDELREGLR